MSSRRSTISGRIERFGPLVGALVGGASFLAYWSWVGPPGRDGFTGVATHLLTVASIAVGFLVTAMTIVLAMLDRPVFKWLRTYDNGSAYDDLLEYLTSSVRSAFLVVALCAAAFALSRLSHTIVYRGGFGLLAAVAGYAGMACYRVLQIIIAIFRIPDRPDWGPAEREFLTIEEKLEREALESSKREEEEKEQRKRKRRGSRSSADQIERR